MLITPGSRNGNHRQPSTHSPCCDPWPRITHSFSSYFLIVALTSCTVLWTDGNGHTRALGTFVEIESPLEHGRVRRFTALGLVLRLGGRDRGATLGIYRQVHWLPELRRFAKVDDLEEVVNAYAGSGLKPHPRIGPRFAMAVLSPRTVGTVVAARTTNVGLGLTFGRAPHAGVLYHRRDELLVEEIGPHAALLLVSQTGSREIEAVVLWRPTAASSASGEFLRTSKP